ncbi:uncharacterized protein LOC142357343 [Convolutriloba macropyga]|uniref:uncharacterized protein LOC142357343 n=1 Tax=Convolutriloba macropyga TaxID=536237 RepID=UPI003F52146A
MVRHVDALDPLPDNKIKEEDAAYLEKHGIDKIFEDVLQRLLMTKPKDHMQYIIDLMTFSNPDDATQDPKTGLSNYRTRKLEKIFEYMDKDVDGKVRYQDVQLFTSRYGGQVLTQDELKEIFTDFDQSEDNSITKDEFYLFFSKVSLRQKNAEFDQMVEEMLD